MFYKQYIPCPELTEYIECYWILRMHHPVFNKQRLVPGGRIEMIFNFESAVSWMIDEHDVITGILEDDASVMGQRNKIFYAAFAGPLHLMGIRFKPGGLAAFSDIPAMQLLNKLLNAEDIFGSCVKNWKEKISDKQHDDEKILLLDTLMLSAFQKRPAEWKSIHAMIDSVRTINDSVSVSAICDQSGWNYKKLERSFLKYTGYAPKQYMRIIRFNKALRQIDKNHQSLTATGFEFGYYDQAHFIKDFIQLAGTTPGRLQTEEHAIANLLVTHQPV
jgi:AraC-like DNA-binding protein